MADPDAPLLTVGMPIYNAGKFLRPAVLSVLAQTFTDWELLIIDDGSTDNAAATVADLTDPRIRILRDGDNRGLAARLNEAVDAGRGRFFARMDQDDISYPERFARQLAALEADPELDLVSVEAIRISTGNRYLGRVPVAHDHAAICAQPWRSFYLPHPTWMGRMAWFRKHRYASPGPYLCEDQELLLRAYPESRFAVLPEVLFAYRMPDRIRPAKRFKTRLSVLRVQLGHFRRRRQWRFALLATLACVVRLAMDGVGLARQAVGWRRRAAVDPAEAGRWYDLGRTVAACQRLCFVATVPMPIRAFMLDHLRRLAEDHDVTVVTNCTPEDRADLATHGITVVNIPFERKPAPWRDLVCLVKLYRFLRAGDFAAVHSVMPKTGLLTAIAGWAARVPRRLHLFTGQVWATRRGLSRQVFKTMDRVIGALATNVYADSASQRDFLVREGVIRAGSVLGDGSVNGVDTERFKPDPAARRAVRADFGIAEDALLFGFVGRLNRDKGIADLVEAFTTADLGAAELLLVGPDEEGIEAMVRDRFPDHVDRIHFQGYTSTPERFYAAMDVFCLPSYREGFGSSVIEAAACGAPALASRIYGLTDAVAADGTGLMHEPHDVAGIRAGLERYAADPDLRRRFAEQARARVLRAFTTARLVDLMAAEYHRLLGGEA